MPKVGVVLSGCGVYDGSEIHEAVITLLALDRAGAEAVCMAPDVQQMQVVNHLTGEAGGRGEAQRAGGVGAHRPRQDPETSGRSRLPISTP